MKLELRSRHGVHILLSVLTMSIVLLASIVAQAAIIGTSARVFVRVQELIDGQSASVDSDESDLVDAGDLPLTASASLNSTDLEGALVAFGRGFAEFADPTRLDQPNPEEFAIETGAFTNVAPISYIIEGTAAETRTVLFTTPGDGRAPPEITFGTSLRRDVESSIFLSGAMMVWSTEANADIEGLLAELSVSLTRDDTNEEVFSTGLTLQAGISRRIDSQSTGPLQFEELTIGDLRGRDIDEDTLAILEQVKSDGLLYIAAIPAQEHDYRYTVTANQAFNLQAELQLRIDRLPTGIGVACVLGRPFGELAEILETSLPGVDGGRVQRSLNAAVAERAIAQTSDRPTPGSACGVFGLEALALAAFGFFFCFQSRRCPT